MEPPAGPPPPIPLGVLTGFLGAGKTSLLNRLLREPALADTVVIVNEFGEIGLDHLLVETVDEGLVLLAAGCLCCTVRGDLIATLEDLLRRRDNGRMPPFRRVVIETTGLADPAPILHALLYHPYLAQRYALAAVVTLVDAVNGADTLDAHAEAVRQVAVADRLVLTKGDLLEDGAGDGPGDGADALPALRALRARLSALNPGAPCLTPAEALADPEALFGGLFGLDGKLADVAGWLGAGAVLEAEARAHAHQPGQHEHGHHEHGHHGGRGHHGHHHAHHHAHQHDVNRHDASVRAFCLSSDAPVPRIAFEGFLDLLRSAHGPKLLRLKGLVGLADDPDRPVVVHGVQHVLHALVRLDAWPRGAEDRRSRLVLIVRDLAPAFVERLWDAFLGRPAPDAADAAALLDNPLAPPGLRLPRA